MSEHAGAPRKARAGPTPEPWGRAFLTSAVMLGACYLLLVLVPNNLQSYLSLHTQPRVRDLLVTLWWVAAFVGCCVLFVRLQWKREG
jgi:hypothetical protein